MVFQSFRRSDNYCIQLATAGMAAEALLARADRAFVEEDYDQAINLYTEASHGG